MGAYNNDILVIHIPKCGGWTAKRFCQHNLPGILMPENPASKLPLGHVRLADIQRFTGYAPSHWKRILACVRNPYEQQVSQAAFWAMRHLRGERHIHDVATWRHVSEEIVAKDFHKAAMEGPPFQFAPRHINLTGFVTDPRCDFHVWYQQHIEGPPRPAPEGHNTYQDYGGMFRYWLEIDGEIPDNVHVMHCENLAEELPAAIAEFVDHELPPVPTLNTSPWSGQAWEWYTPTAMRAVEEKCPWAFEHFYEKWTIEVNPPSPEPVLV
jgi:hypothetical protein